MPLYHYYQNIIDSDDNKELSKRRKTLRCARHFDNTPLPPCFNKKVHWAILKYAILGVGCPLGPFISLLFKTAL